MAIKDHKKFADAIVLDMKGKKPDESSDEDAKDDDEKEPGKLGRVLASALRHSDYEAIEEAIRNIVSDCPSDE